PGIRRRSQPVRRTLDAEREICVETNRAALVECTRRIAEEWLCKQVLRVRTDRRQLRGAPRRKKTNRPDAELVEKTTELILDDIGK
ncbi:hypothetical protein, partial [Vibrio cholerae]|uniref:hypothetical protein n=1 Tax=Vibrio cholerae TaxID=666 RepID=UPI0018F07593